MKNIRVLGGQMSFPNLNTSLSGEDYDVAKLHMWLHMLGEGNRPQKWLKPSKKGTKVNFDTIQNQEDYDEGLGEAKSFMERVNMFHGLDFKIERD